MNKTDKGKLEKKIDPNWENLTRDSETNYIICSDLNCNGFFEERLQCVAKYFGEVCPEKDKAYRILHCGNGHVNKLVIDESIIRRIDCHECGESSFKLMSGKYYRVSLELIDEFFKKDFI